MVCTPFEHPEKDDHKDVPVKLSLFLSKIVVHPCAEPGFQKEVTLALKMADLGNHACKSDLSAVDLEGARKESQGLAA